MLRGTGTAERRRSGFTLIEVMVVLLIIAVLAALLIPAVFRAQDSAKRAQTTFQMTQIGQAADLFTTGDTFNRIGYLPPAPFRLQATYNSTDAEASYFKQLFPNLPTDPTTGVVTTNMPAAMMGTLQDNNQVALFFLTGGPAMNYQGFATSSQQPFNPPNTSVAGEKRRGPLLQTTDGMTQTNPRGVTANGLPWLVDPYGTPYAIFVSRGNSYPSQAVTYGGVSISPFYRGSASSPKYENAKGIQVISAGRDKTFGGGGLWDNLVNKPASMDDSSNFSNESLGYGPK